MARRKYLKRRYPRYRSSVMAGGASVNISEFKANPIKYIYAAEVRPIKILRYGHLAALIITPEFYDELATDLENTRAALENVKVLLHTLSPDLLRYWQQIPGEFLKEQRPFADLNAQKLPNLAKEYVVGVEEILDDLANESENGQEENDINFRVLAEQYRKMPKQHLPPRFDGF